MKTNHAKLKTPELIEETTSGQRQDIQISDIKYQNISYCMINRNKRVNYYDFVSIDFLKAANELSNLDWSYKKNGISFFNWKKDDNIWCHRMDENMWLVLTAVKKNGIYTGYQWYSYPDNESLMNTIRLFFEELNWFASLGWETIKWKNDFNTLKELV